MNKILKITHLLITEKNSNEVRLSGRFGFVITIITCCVGLLICSDGKANTNWHEQGFKLEISEDGELHCIDINTNKRVHLKNCPEIF